MSFATGNARQVYLYGTTSSFMRGALDFKYSGSASSPRYSSQSVCMPLTRKGDSSDAEFSAKFLAVPLAASGSSPTDSITEIGTMAFPQLTSTAESGEICLTVTPSAVAASDIKVLAMATTKSTAAGVKVTYATCAPGSGCSAFSATPWATESVGDAVRL